MDPEDGSGNEAAADRGQSGTPGNGDMLLSPGTFWRALAPRFSGGGSKSLLELGVCRDGAGRVSCPWILRPVWATPSRIPLGPFPASNPPSQRRSMGPQPHPSVLHPHPWDHGPILNPSL